MTAAQEIEDLKRVWDKSELSECIRSIGGPLRGYDNIIEVRPLSLCAQCALPFQLMERYDSILLCTRNPSRYCLPCNASDILSMAEFSCVVLAHAGVVVVGPSPTASCMFHSNRHRQ